MWSYEDAFESRETYEKKRKAKAKSKKKKNDDDEEEKDDEYILDNVPPLSTWITTYNDDKEYKSKYSFPASNKKKIIKAYACV